MANDLVRGANLGPEFLIGTGAAADKIEIKVDDSTVKRDPATGELSAPSGALTFDNATSVLTFDNGAGGVQPIDLSGFLVDVFVNGGSFDPATQIITFVDNDGGSPDITIDLSSLLGVSTDVNNGLTNGADGKPFFDASALSGVSTDADQLLTVGADGKPFLDCAKISADCGEVCTDVFGNPVLRAFAL
jgi:hypothetical protein